MKFLFLHGGPGFNSFAEQAILGPVIREAGHDVDFWNEPSRLRPDGDLFEPTGAFAHWYASAQRALLSFSAMGPICLIAHSFSIHPAIELARRHPDCVTSLVLVAPATNPFASYTNVLRLAQRDLETEAPAIASAISDCLARTRIMMDDAMRDGLSLVLHDTKIFTHYWADPEQFRLSLAARAKPEAQFDVDSFFGVLQDFCATSTSLQSNAPIIVPTLALFGEQDAITTFNEQWQPLKTLIPHATAETFDDCSHYVHLDRPQRFLDAICAWQHDMTK